MSAIHLRGLGNVVPMLSCFFVYVCMCKCKRIMGLSCSSICPYMFFAFNHRTDLKWILRNGFLGCYTKCPPPPTKTLDWYYTWAYVCWNALAFERCRGCGIRWFWWVFHTPSGVHSQRNFFKNSCVSVSQVRVPEDGWCSVGLSYTWWPQASSFIELFGARWHANRIKLLAGRSWGLRCLCR